jgi:hypothetical protein
MLNARIFEHTASTISLISLHGAMATDLYNLWMKAVWTTLVGCAAAATPNDVGFAFPFVLTLPLTLVLGLVLGAVEPFPFVGGDAFPDSPAGCFSARRSLPGLPVGGAMETALVGVMSMASEGVAEGGS